MSAKSNSSDNIAKLEKQLAKIQALERNKLINENILRLEKNGDISYETVRTVGVPVDRTAFHSPTGANSYTETPASQENGQQFDPSLTALAPPIDQTPPTQVIADEGLNNNDLQASSTDHPLPGTGISIHGDQTAGQQIAPADADSADPLEELLARALSRPRRGRPATFDEHNKGKLVALLSLGMSLRQAASVLGVSHGTIHNTLKADPALAEEITAARFQAQLQPLACVIREARRSWKAATWLLKYLDAKIATHEETPDERRARQQRESDEFFARSPAPSAKTRRVLG
jgi:hypothetical protein